MSARSTHSHAARELLNGKVRALFRLSRAGFGLSCSDLQGHGAQPNKARGMLANKVSHVIVEETRPVQHVGAVGLQDSQAKGLGTRSAYMVVEHDWDSAEDLDINA